MLMKTVFNLPTNMLIEGNFLGGFIMYNAEGAPGYGTQIWNDTLSNGLLIV